MIFKKLKITLGIIMFFAIIILLNSCDKNAYDFNTDKLSTNTEVNSLLALPLVDASITLEELIPDSEEFNRYLTIDENKFISISFESVLSTYDILAFMGNEPLSGTSLADIDYLIDPQLIDLGLNTLLGEGGSVHFANPSLKLLIKNYWDIPTQFKFNDFYYYEEENSVALPLTGSITTDWQPILQPANPGGYAITELVLDTATSNIDEVLSAMPHHLSFGGQFKTTPGDPYDLNGVDPNEVSIEISLPLEISLTNVVLTDTIDFGISENLDTTSVKSFKINFLANNGFPLGMNIQVYFADSVGNELVNLDSLFTTSLQIDPATVISNDQTEKTESVSTIEININRLDNILRAKYIIPKIVFNTANAASNEDVKLYSSHNIELKMGALIEYYANFK